MSTRKKLTIAVVLLFAIFLICAFGLSLISEAFLVVAFYSGIGGGFGFIGVLTDKPKLIPIGLGMMFVSINCFFAMDFYPLVNAPLAVLCTAVGAFVFVKGFKVWRLQKRTKQRAKNKISVGICLLVGGFIESVISFFVFPTLMVIGHVMLFVGFLILGRGLSEKKCGNVSSQASKNTVCERCGLSFPTEAIFVFEGEKCCGTCKTRREENIKNQHVVCSECGVDWPIENMHAIDDAMLCHSCFLKKYGNVDYE